MPEVQIRQCAIAKVVSKLLDFSVFKILPALLFNFNSISMVWKHALDTQSEGRISPLLHPTLTQLTDPSIHR